MTVKCRELAQKLIKNVENDNTAFNNITFKKIIFRHCVKLFLKISRISVGLQGVKLYEKDDWHSIAKIFKLVTPGIKPDTPEKCHLNVKKWSKT